MNLLLRKRFNPHGIGTLARAGDVSRLNLIPDAACSTYTDRSGKARDYTQTLTARPTFKLNIFNTRPGLLFASASSQYMFNNALGALLSGTDVPFTVYALVKFLDGDSQAVWSVGKTDTNTPFHRLRGTAGGLWNSNRRDDSNTASAVEAAGYTTGVNYIAALSFDGTAVSVDVNGASVFAAQAQNVGTLTLNRCGLGAAIQNTGGATLFLDGYIGADLMYLGFQTASTRARVARAWRNRRN